MNSQTQETQDELTEARFHNLAKILAEGDRLMKVAEDLIAEAQTHFGNDGVEIRSMNGFVVDEIRRAPTRDRAIDLLMAWCMSEARRTLGSLDSLRSFPIERG